MSYDKKESIYKKNLYNSNNRFSLDYKIKDFFRRCANSKKTNKIIRSKYFKIFKFNLDDFISVIENNFSPGMSWENYGKWHIDHKIPKTEFKYEKLEDLECLECWCLDNLQPMWAEDNLKKYNKLRN